MHTTFAKIGKEIALEVGKSAVLVIISSIVAASLRNATKGATEGFQQAANYTRNKIFDLRHKEKAA
jgi:hypothetical protein